MSTTRGRKYKYIHSFGPNAGFDAVKELYARDGLDMLSDEQLAEVVLQPALDGIGQR